MWTASPTAQLRGINTYQSKTASHSLRSIADGIPHTPQYQHQWLMQVVVLYRCMCQVLRLVLDSRSARCGQRPNQSSHGRQARCDARTTSAAQLRKEQGTGGWMRRRREVTHSAGSGDEMREQSAPLLRHPSTLLMVWCRVDCLSAVQLRRVRVHAQVGDIAQQAPHSSVWRGHVTHRCCVLHWCVLTGTGCLTSLAPTMWPSLLQCATSKRSAPTACQSEVRTAHTTSRSVSTRTSTGLR